LLVADPLKPAKLSLAYTWSLESPDWIEMKLIQGEDSRRIQRQLLMVGVIMVSLSSFTTPLFLSPFFLPKTHTHTLID
jgi:hypothetical protein